MGVRGFVRPHYHHHYYPSHYHGNKMRIYWRQFACYSFMLTLLGVHVVFQYAVVPNALNAAGSEWAPAESISGADLALACEQWIGRRSLKSPKGIVAEVDDSDDGRRAEVAPLFGSKTRRRHLGGGRRVSDELEIGQRVGPKYNDLTMRQDPLLPPHPRLPIPRHLTNDDGQEPETDSPYRHALSDNRGGLGGLGDKRAFSDGATPRPAPRQQIVIPKPPSGRKEPAGELMADPGADDRAGAAYQAPFVNGKSRGPAFGIRTPLKSDQNYHGNQMQYDAQRFDAQAETGRLQGVVTGGFIVPAPSPDASTTKLWTDRFHGNRVKLERGNNVLLGQDHVDRTSEMHQNLPGDANQGAGQGLSIQHQGLPQAVPQGDLHMNQGGLPMNTGNGGSMYNNIQGSQYDQQGLNYQRHELNSNGFYNSHQGAPPVNLRHSSQHFVLSSNNQAPLSAMDKASKQSSQQGVYQRDNTIGAQASMVVNSHIAGGVDSNNNLLYQGQQVPGLGAPVDGSYNGGQSKVVIENNKIIETNINNNNQQMLLLPGQKNNNDKQKMISDQGIVPSAGSVNIQGVFKSRTRDDSTNPHHQRYIFNCANIQMITIKRKLGQGVTKQVYLGVYENRKVAVKMVTRNVIDVLSCMKKLRREASDLSTLPGEKHKCYTLPNMKLMKEILLLNQLDHPNLLKLLGYCVRSEETDSTSLQEHGIVAVYEYGLRFYISNLREWPWQLRVKTATELADLLEYLQHSPLGSLRISDFKDAHFLLKDGRIKLTDLDDVTSMEPTCQPNLGPEIDLKGNRTPAKVCGFNLKCVAGICPGYNAMKNIDNFNRLFFSNLLTGDTPETEEHMSRLRSRLDNLSIDASELRRILFHFMDVPFLPGYT